MTPITRRTPLTPMLTLAVGLLTGSLFGCSDPATATPADCDEACRHDTAVLGLRETLKLVYNLTLQGNPVGPQDETTPCPLGGSARVFGEATSNPRHGATEVDLTYELQACRYLRRDEEPDESYDLTITGTVRQLGTLAAQPSATTALILESDALSLTGSVYDPPIAYSQSDCRVTLGQNGNQLSGELCGNVVGVDL